MKRKTKSDKQLAVIDALTGMVLSPERLFVVVASERVLDKAGEHDDTAFNLADLQGEHIDQALLHVLYARHNRKWRTFTAAEVRAIADIFGFDVGCDNDGQLVLYTDVKERT